MNSPRAGQPAQPSDLVDVAALVTAYYTREPDPEDVDQQVAFGTSGHRGSSLRTSFNEAHILATTQAICEYRAEQGFDGPLFVGRDTHGLSEPAWSTALEVLAANDVTVLVDSGDRYTPTPAVSHAILTANRGKVTGVDGMPARAGLADGIVVTPSHNPPSDGGFKYNPPHGGPADSDATKVIAARANELIRGGLAGVRRVPFARARAAAHGIRLPRHATSTTCRTSWTSTRSGTPASASAPTRWGARPSTTGARSRTATASTSPSSTRSSTRPGAS